MNTLLEKALAALVLALLLFGAGYHYGERHVQYDWDKAKLEQAAAVAKAEEAARQKETDWNTRLKEAQDEGRAKLEKLQKDLAAANDAASSLQHQLANAKRAVSTAPVDAVRQYAGALSDVFGQCVQRYKEVAAAADECDAALTVVQKAWPQSQ